MTKVNKIIEFFSCSTEKPSEIILDIDSLTQEEISIKDFYIIWCTYLVYKNGFDTEDATSIRNLDIHLKRILHKLVCDNSPLNKLEAGDIVRIIKMIAKYSAYYDDITCDQIISAFTNKESFYLD